MFPRVYFPQAYFGQGYFTVQMAGDSSFSLEESFAYSYISISIGETINRIMNPGTVYLTKKVNLNAESVPTSSTARINASLLLSRDSE